MANCTEAKVDSGLGCVDGSAFQICNNARDDNFRSFVGCCKSTPAFTDKSEYGCKQNEILDATYNKVDGLQPQPRCVNTQVQAADRTWRNCKREPQPAANNDGSARYIGCCDTACNTDPSFRCPPNQKGWAGFADRDSLNSFLREYGKPTSTSITPSPSNTSSTAQNAPTTSPDGTPSSSNSTGSQGADQPKSSGLSDGGVAGIAIGCVLGGLLLGGLAAILFFRRRKQRRQRRAPQPEPDHVQVPYVPGKECDHLSSQPIAARHDGEDDVRLSQFLLSPTPDNEIVSGLRSLDTLVRQHVENNYHLQPVQQSPKSLAQALVALGLPSEPQGQRGPDDVARLAVDARTRSAALQHVITRVALQSSTLSVGSGTAPVSMLPPSVAMFAHSVPATERHRGNAEAVSIAMTKWRQLSAFLLHSQRSERTPLRLPEDDGGAAAQQAQQLARELKGFLGVFVARGSAQQETHLCQVLVECARFGYLLFSQRAEYRFNYEGRSGGRQGGGVVVCPGLERVSDGEGRRLSKPHVLSAPVEDS
ncbi:hypothetical protein PG985_016061 [Apiospora marii]|uniref:uncharacterized protein n=1 Tax=Apiospora marii TaxID=335849 RepID=UPI0031307E39